MILVALFAIAGSVMGLFGLLVTFQGGPSWASLLAALPFLGSAAAFLGIAQVIHSLGRTADATESMRSEMKTMVSELQLLRTGQPRQTTQSPDLQQNTRRDQYGRPIA